MVNEQGKHLPIACRYVPYDQWFITHIDPTWKIKHLKQRIISKCLNLPFDPRFLQKRVTPNARPPSPITFAPDTSIRPDSPIEFATPGSAGSVISDGGTGAGGDDQESTGGFGDEGYEGYEEDDEWEQDFDIGGSLSPGKIGPSNVKVKSKSSSSLSTVSPSYHARLQQKQKQEQEPQITTHTYTLFRFSTGQILEEDFQVSWYDLQPHELVELHSSFLPPTFTSSLVQPMSHPPNVGGVVTFSHTTSTQKKKKSSTKVTGQEDLSIPSVTALPRHIPNLYIQPYWHGWVRSLRVLWRMRTLPASDEHPHPSVDDIDHYLKGVRGEGAQNRGRGNVERPEIQWRERWVVIYDGVVNICKNPSDSNPTRLPLSSLTALRGPEHLAHSIYRNNGTGKPPVRSKPHIPEPSTASTTTVGSSRTGGHTRPGLSVTSEDLQIGKGQETGRNVPDKEPTRSRSLKKIRKDGKDGKQLFSTTSSCSLRQDLQPHHTSTSPNSKSKSALLPTAEDGEGERKAREIESLKKWEDLVSFTLGGRDKLKDKDKSNSKNKDKEKKERKNKDREREHGTSQQQHHREKERRAKYSENSDKGKSRLKSLRDKDRDRTFIPISREEAEQAGMKVICAKFSLQPAAATAQERDKGVDDIKQSGGFPKSKYTSTGPSLALIAASGPGSGGANVKTKTSTGPHVVIDSDAYIGESSFEDFGGVHGRQSQGILISSGRTTPFSSSGTTTTGPATSGASTTPTTAAGTDSVATCPISHPTTLTWGLFGGIKELPPPPPSGGAAEGLEGLVPVIVNSSGRNSVPPTNLEEEMDAASNEATECGGAGDGKDDEGDAVSIAEPLALSSPMTNRPAVIIPSPTPVVPASTTPAAATVSPESQSEIQPPDQTHDNPDSDSSSSISISSPVFAHSTESDLDDETFVTYGSGGGGTTSGVSSGVSGTIRPRKGYRYGGYHVQVQMNKVKNAGEDERLVDGSNGAAVEVEKKLGDGSQPQQARREENEQEKKRSKGEGREEWIVFDMINDTAFNSILRILHRHSPLPLSSSFTPAHAAVGSAILPQPNISNKPKSNPGEDLHYGSKAQIVPSDTEDDGRYTATAKTLTKSIKAIHPPILESLAARTATTYSTQRPLYVALPYPEWRLELVNRARRAGMREIGRPLDLALHGWGREFEEMAAAARERKFEREMEMEMEMEREKKKRRSIQSYVSTTREKERRISRVVGGSDADDDDDDDLGDGDEEEEEEAIARTQLESDSEEESESDTEWLAWMADLPRQFLVQQSRLAVQPSQTSFTNPFSSSPLLDSDGGRRVRPPRTQEEERLFHADKIRKLEPSAISIVASPTPLADSLKHPLTLSSPSSFESLNYQRGSLAHGSTPFPGVSPPDDLPVNKGGHSRSQSRSLQHSGSYRRVGSVPEERGDDHNPAASSSSRLGLHHSVSVDQHLSSRKNDVYNHRQNDSIASQKRNQYAIGKPILTNEQIMQIESDVVASAPNSSLSSHWTFPPSPIPSPPLRPPSSSSYISHTTCASASTSTLTTRPPSSLSPVPFNTSGGTGGCVEAKAAPLSAAINRFASSDLARWSSSVAVSLSTTSSTPSSPSPSTAAFPNSASPPRSSVFGSLGRSPSLLSKAGASTGQEKEKKGFLLKKRVSRDLGKDKEKEKDRDTGESAISPSLNQRPKLLLSGLSSPSSSPAPHRYNPSLLHEVPSPTHNPSSGHLLYHSPSAISSARALLRRVRSGSSLRGEESANPSFCTASTTSPAGLTVTSPETEGKEVQKKKKGPINRIVRGFDSSLAFAEGR